MNGPQFILKSVTSNEEKQRTKEMIVHKTPLCYKNDTLFHILLIFSLSSIIPTTQHNVPRFGLKHDFSFHQRDQYRY